MVNHRTQLQAQPAMCRQEGIASDLRSHLAIAQDEMRQDCEHGATCRALESPDGDATQTDTHIMRMAREASTAATGGFVFQLKAKRQHEGKDTWGLDLPGSCKGFKLSRQRHRFGWQILQKFLKERIWSCGRQLHGHISSR